MIRVVSLVKLTDEGAREMSNIKDTVAKVRETSRVTAKRLSMLGRPLVFTTSLRS